MLELLLCFGAGVATSTWLHRRIGRRSKHSPPPPAKAELTFSGPQCAAFLFCGLPPELSALLFNEMTPETVHRVTLEVSKVPLVDLQARAEVMRNFCRSLGIPENDESLQEAVRTEPALVAKALSILARP